MKRINKLLQKTFRTFGKREKIIYPLVIAVIFILSILSKDSKIALVSAICGISYTILAGKGMVSCYFIGLCGSFCYAYLAFINGFFGNVVLYLFYYIPMQIIGIFKWNKHLKKETRVIEKTRLTKKELILYYVITFLLSVILSVVLYCVKDKNPIIDSFTTVLSVLGLLLTVKRCIEQWYVWFIVNFLSLIMWVSAYIKGADCLATMLMWGVYLILSIYFLIEWKKEMKQ